MVIPFQKTDTQRPNVNVLPYDPMKIPALKSQLPGAIQDWKDQGKRNTE